MSTRNIIIGLMALAMVGMTAQGATGWQMLCHDGVMTLTMPQGDSIVATTTVVNDAPLPKIVSQTIVIARTDGTRVATLAGETHILGIGDTAIYTARGHADSLLFWTNEYGTLYRVVSILTEKGRIADSQTVLAGFRSGQTAAVSLLNDMIVPQRGDTVLMPSYTERTESDTTCTLRTILYYPEEVSEIALTMAHTGGRRHRYEVWATTSRTLMGRVYSQRQMVAQGYTDGRDGLHTLPIPETVNGERNRVRASVYEIIFNKETGSQIADTEIVDSQMTDRPSLQLKAMYLLR